MEAFLGDSPSPTRAAMAALPPTIVGMLLSTCIRHKIWIKQVDVLLSVCPSSYKIRLKITFSVVGLYGIISRGANLCIYVVTF